MRPGWPPAVFSPRRTISPTREGWWCLFVTIGLGVTAVNSGNNLLYLLVSLLLALIFVSGVLSEQTIRGVRITSLVPDEVFAGRPATVGATVVNDKRLPARSLVLETADGSRVIPVRWLPPGGDRVLAWEHEFPRRGRHRLPGLKVTTRFPFGLFVKSGRAQDPRDVVVYPAPVTSAAGRLSVSSTGDTVETRRRRGRGQELHDLRPYRDGDDPRLIHWRVSARTGVVTVREMEAGATADVRIVLRGTGTPGADRLERALGEAVALTLHFIGRGAAVSLAGPGVAVPPGRGRDHARLILEALALYEPGRPAAAATPEPARARDVVVDLD